MIAKKLFISAIFIFFLLILVINYFNSLDDRFVDKIYPNVFLDNTNIGKKTKAELKKILHQKNLELEKLIITVFYDDKPVASYSATALDIHSNRDEILDRAYLIGRTPILTSRYYQKITSLFGLNKYYFDSRIDYDKTPLTEFINLSEEKYNKPARNALFKFENGRVSSFRQEENGLKILSESFFSDLEKEVQKLKKTPQNISLILKDQIIKPEITLDQANQFGIKEEIGMGKSNFTHSAPERVHNITLASSKFDGILILKDKEFSFNKTVGDISILTGYKPAYIIKSGKTVLGDGGGVCQVSTTMFRAALNIGLPITERNAHAYRVGYYENDSKPGFDATVFDPSADFKFKNDTPGAILIQTEIDKVNNLLYFRFYGKNDGRNVEISSISLYDQQPPPEAKYQDDPTLKRGVTKQIDFAAWGAKASFNYKVYRDEKTIFEKTFFSTYRPWQAVFLVGTAD